VNAFVYLLLCFLLELNPVSSWLPLDHLSHCLAHTECKIALLDPERADLLQPVASQLLQTSIIKSFLVFDLSQPRKRRDFMPSLEEVLENFQDHQPFLPQTLINPEDNATIIFTSGTRTLSNILLSVWTDYPPGTTGLPKGVLSTQRQFLTNVLNVCTSYMP
jgi:long-subunit acyl-CoA synthetase (AMP-forming)